MRIPRIVLLSLCGFCLAQTALAQSRNVLSGQLNPEAADENGGLFVHTSQSFDPDEARTLASQAHRDGDYGAAFSHYLAVCVGSEPNDADSCYRAAELANDQELDDVPDTLRTHLYERACQSGHEDACRE